jgi:hypothetical protein
VERADVDGVEAEVLARVAADRLRDLDAVGLEAALPQYRHAEAGRAADVERAPTAGPARQRKVEPAAEGVAIQPLVAAVVAVAERLRRLRAPVRLVLIDSREAEFVAAGGHPPDAAPLAPPDRVGRLGERRPGALRAAHRALLDGLERRFGDDLHQPKYSGSVATAS